MHDFLLLKHSKFIIENCLFPEGDILPPAGMILCELLHKDFYVLFVFNIVSLFKLLSKKYANKVFYLAFNLLMLFFVC